MQFKFARYSIRYTVSIIIMQMRVDSTDGHEKTKELVWKRSSHIASVVSHKLVAATKSMLKPPPSKFTNNARNKI